MDDKPGTDAERPDIPPGGGRSGRPSLAHRVVLVLATVVVAVGVVVVGRFLNHDDVAILWDPTDSMNSRAWFGDVDNAAYAHWLKECCLPGGRQQFGDDSVSSFHLVPAIVAYAADPSSRRGRDGVTSYEPSDEPSSSYMRAIRPIAQSMARGYARQRFLVIIGDLLEQKHPADLPKLPLAPPPTPTPDEKDLFGRVTVVLIHPVGCYPLGTPADRERYPEEWVDWWRAYFLDRGCQTVEATDFHQAPALLDHLGLWRSEAPGRPSLDQGQ